MEEQFNTETPPVSKRESVLKKLTIAGFVSSGLAVVGFAVLMFAVVCDWGSFVEFVTLPIVFLSLLMSGVGIVASSIRKRWLQAGGGCGCLVLALAVGFFVAVIVAIGQHHPPERDDIDTCECVNDDWGE